MEFIFDMTPASVAIADSKQRFPIRRIYCVGRNYLEHIHEMKEGDERDLPFFFQKPSDAIVSDGAVVPYPPFTDDFQFEGELVIAIGQQASNVSVEDALQAVYGYAAGVDLTRRDRQRESFREGKPWEVGKSFDYSAAVGRIHPVAQAGHLLQGDIVLELNGQERQRGKLQQMIWNPPEIIAQLSRQYVLQPGDLIMTGTPAGVGQLAPGDEVRVLIEGLAPFEFSIGPREE